MKKKIISSLAIVLGLATSFASSYAFEPFTDYSSGQTQVVEQFTDLGGDYIHFGGSMALTGSKLGLSLMEENAVGVLIILFVLGLWAFIGYRRRMKKMNKSIS